MSEIRVQKRNGKYEEVKFDKITARIKNLCFGLDSAVNPTRVAQDTIKKLYNGITTVELDILSAKNAEEFKLLHPDYSVLAARILVSNLHKTTSSRFSKCIRIIQEKLGIIGEYYYEFITKHAATLDAMILHANDYNLEYFGFKTLENSYLYKFYEDVVINGEKIYVDRKNRVVKPSDIVYTTHGVPQKLVDGKMHTLRPKKFARICDRPQYVFMREAIAINYNSVDPIDVIFANIRETYQDLSKMIYTHATPTLFNACNKNQQLNSCFLLGTEDSIEGIMRNLSNASFISKRAGGIGIHMHNIRSAGSHIRGTNGESTGLPKQLKMYNEAARTWDQGGKRLGAIAIYLEPWHGDIVKVLKMKHQVGKDEERARDLFYALWHNDLFVTRVRNGEPWSLFSESSAPGLSDVYDGMMVCKYCNHCENENYQRVCDKLPYKIQPSCAEHAFEPRNVFTQLYTYYEQNGHAADEIDARELLDLICETQRDSGGPYTLFKDHINRQSNQMNMGTIKSSNLCAEVVEWSDDNSYACCTLGSINLRKFVVDNDIDYASLHTTTRRMIRNLDIIIDINQYPVAECDKNSQQLRPIGAGVQALADVYAMLRIPFLSERAEQIDVAITETIMHAALTESVARAKTYGAYSKFAGSPASKGILTPDLWLRNQTTINGFKKIPYSGRYDWDALRQEIMQHGLRNSLHVAFMPTVSTSQILGNNESFEPFHSNIYTKTTLAGKFTLANTHMIRHLIELGLWNDDTKNKIVNNNGSVQGISIIPLPVQEIYKTMWEMSQNEIMRRAAMRSAFIDQSQSLNIHVNKNDKSVLRAIFLSGWSLGLKTGSYYIRSRSATSAMKNNIAQTREANKEVKPEVIEVCTLGGDCTSCSA